METEYWTVCPACDVETQVMVIDEEEPPNYCPMCGSSSQYEEMENDEQCMRLYTINMEMIYEQRLDN